MNNIENLKDLIIYQSQNNENISVEVLYNEEDFWLTQKSMAKLFNVAENNITYHLQNIFKTGELNENRTTQKIRVVQNEGNSMGLTTWRNAPDGKILETDVTIAKNYLSQEEITELNNLVSMYLDYAERQVKLGKIISMKEWKEKLEVFLKINEYNILKDNGKIKREIADKLALDEYKKYRVIQDKNYISDFDELVIETKNLNKT